MKRKVFITNDCWLNHNEDILITALINQCVFDFSLRALYIGIYENLMMEYFNSGSGGAEDLMMEH